MKSFIVAALGITVLLSGCSTKNHYEREADKITNAVIADNRGPVFNDFDSSAQPTLRRVAVARLADELNGQGNFWVCKRCRFKTKGRPLIPSTQSSRSTCIPRR